MELAVSHCRCRDSEYQCRQQEDNRRRDAEGDEGPNVSPVLEQTVFLSADARSALADYLERERSRDADGDTQALFLSATGIPARGVDGRLSVRAINLILEQIGRWHDAELDDPARHISPLRPHDLRHTFAFHLATGMRSFIPMW
jgi:integrase